MINVVEDQHYLAEKCNISLNESLKLPVFEFEAHTNLMMKDLKKKAEQAAAAAQNS